MHASAERYGSDTACARIAEAATDNGWDVAALLPYEGPLCGELRGLGVAVTVLDPIVLRRADLRGWRAGLLPLRWSRSAKSLHSFLRNGPSYDVVHTNCAPTVGGLLIARWSRAKHVWYVHEIFPEGIQRRVFDQLLRRSADIVLACSRAALDQFPGVVAAGIGRVAHTGIEIAHVPTTEPMVRPAPVVVCVGRLNAWKGQEVLVDAMGILLGRGVDLRAELVGSYFRDQSQYEDRLRAQVQRLGLVGHVEFLGERTDALEIVARADISVTPSTQPEPFGTALVEAMALGRPVVASAGGGPTEIINDGEDGLLVPPGDVVALADALQRLIEAPEFARALGAQARVRAADFSSRSMTKVVLASYEELLRRGPE